MRLLVLAATLAFLGALLAACGSPTKRSGFKDQDNKEAPETLAGADAGPGGPLLASDGAPAPYQPTDCSDAAKLVYVVSAENDLYSFKPAELVFTKIGALKCAAASGASPFSMAVDRKGIAWVNYTDGALFNVNTADASCSKTAYVVQNGFTNFGMGFSSNGASTSDESLFLAGIKIDVLGAESALGLAKLDVTTMQLTLVSQFAGAQKDAPAELTGTGDGRLFGFFEGTPAVLAEVTKSNATTPTPRALTGLALGTDTAFAFSAWGGDFWFYTAVTGQTSKVTRLKTATDNSVAVVVESTGFTIVGAGVSTCAPTTPPR